MPVSDSKPYRERDRGRKPGNYYVASGDMSCTFKSEDSHGVLERCPLKYVGSRRGYSRGV